MSRLYATVSSEKASKGQGGNKYIKTVLAVGSAKDSETVAVIVLTKHGDDYMLAVRIEDDRVIERIIKGKRQKGEDHKCKTLEEQRKCAYG